MQITSADFFSQFLWTTPDETLKVFDNPLFDAHHGFLHFLHFEKIDVAALPTLELPDTVLFPDELLVMSAPGSLLQRVEQLNTVALWADRPPEALVKFRAPGGPRKDEVFTLGTVCVVRGHGSAASLSVLTQSRAVSDQKQDERLCRNPVYSVFDCCADFAEARENFVKLVRQSPGIDGVQGGLLLDMMDQLALVGRYYVQTIRRQLPQLRHAGGGGAGVGGGGVPRRGRRLHRGQPDPAYTEPEGFRLPAAAVVRHSRSGRTRTGAQRVHGGCA